MKVQKIKLSSYDVTWIVLDDHHLPIKPITEFIRVMVISGVWGPVIKGPR